jgi:cytochrome c oxidase subunit 3
MSEATTHRPARPNLAADEPQNLSRGKVGISCLIITESFFFACFIVAYLYYIVILKVEDGGPDPRDLFRADIMVYIASVTLLSSSVTVVLAARALAGGAVARFRAWLVVTRLLGGFVLLATVLEWMHLIGDLGMWMNTSSLGTCFFSLVGFHALHVVIGLTALSLCLVLSLMGHLPQAQAERFEILSWYWHFVDVVWILVFTSVYLLRVYI